MKFAYLKDKQEFISIVLHGVSAFLAVLILINAISFFVSSARAERLVERAVAQSELDPNDMEKYFVKSREIADELKKKNLFAPPPPKKRHPVKQVSGIFGDEALIKGKWYKVGDKIGDAKIVAIEPTQVRIEWEGKEKVFAPIKSTSASEPEKKEKERVERKRRRPKRSRRDRERAEEKAAAPAEDDPLAWMGVELSPALRAKMLEKWNEMSDEEKEQMKEGWSKMSDEEKQKAVSQWKRT